MRYNEEQREAYRKYQIIITAISLPMFIRHTVITSANLALLFTGK